MDTWKTIKLSFPEILERLNSETYSEYSAEIRSTIEVVVGNIFIDVADEVNPPEVEPIICTLDGWVPDPDPIV